MPLKIRTAAQSRRGVSWHPDRAAVRDRARAPPEVLAREAPDQGDAAAAAARRARTHQPDGQEPAADQPAGAVELGPEDTAERQDAAGEEGPVADEVAERVGDHAAPVALDAPQH